MYSNFIDSGLELTDDRSKILVALSGGADSVALLIIFDQLRRDGKITHLEAVHINHNLRHEESLRDQHFCEDLCRRLNISLEVVSITLDKDSAKKGIEELARERRYEIFSRFINNGRATLVALGHHKDDRVETLLFNLFRGCGLNGLTSIKRKRDHFIRPLLPFRKSEIINFLDDQKIPFIIDSSNLSNDYSRNIIRNSIIPSIEKLLNRKIVEPLNRISTISEECEEFVENYIGKLMGKEEFSFSYNSIITINKNLFLEEKPFIRKEIISKIFREDFFTYSPHSQQISEIVESLETYSKPFNSCGLSFELYKKWIIVYKTDLENRIIFNSEKSIETDLFTLSLSSDILSKQYFDMGKVEGDLRFEPLSKDDLFIPFGKGYPVKIPKLLSDKKVPHILRDKLYCLKDSRSLIYIYGVGTDNRFKVDNPNSKICNILEKGVVDLIR